jgi:multidrug efflux pump subunit AcrA (membrane-fusion protein)
MAVKARADVDVAKAGIREKRSKVLAADAHTSFRKQEWQRFKGMAERGTITANVVAERFKDYEEAEADSESARAALDKAQADLTAALEKVNEADADVRYRAVLVEVARRDRDVARELLGYATLRAPFDGVVTRRKVDPGSFVQNSATGRGEVLLTIERSDIVTLYMNLPDNYAPFVGRGTQADVEMSVLPGVTIRGKVSRYSGSLITEANDRTMRVEVDLWNTSPQKRTALLEKVAGAQHLGRAVGAWSLAAQGRCQQSLAAGPALYLLAAAASADPAVEQARASNSAGFKDGYLPIVPAVQGPKAPKSGSIHLLPGMYGTMRLVLQRFQNVHLIPSGAVFSQGGKSYVYLVKDGVARLCPVEVQVDDGHLAKVLLIETVDHEEVKRDPTGDDVLVLSNQGELSDGQAVRPTPTDW